VHFSPRGSVAQGLVPCQRGIRVAVVEVMNAAELHIDSVTPLQLSRDELIAAAGDAFLAVDWRANGKMSVSVHALRRRVASTRTMVWIGRNPDNDIVIDDPTVSKMHAFVRQEGDAYFIMDALSRNGTFVDAAPVTKHGYGKGTTLKRDCVIRFGGVIAMYLNAMGVIDLMRLHGQRVVSLTALGT
jgi:hypothetical protein